MKGTRKILLIYVNIVLVFSTITNELFGRYYNVRDYGIEADNPNNAQRINKLIEEVFLAGGGTVYFPSGEYLTGAIELKSNINLSLDPGTILKFSGDFDDYPFVQTRWSGVECIGFSPLIYANGAENVSITGSGIIDGNAFSWWKRQLEIISGDKENIKPTGSWEIKLAALNKNADPGDLNGPYRTYWLSQFLRPPVIQFYNCTNVLMRDFTVKNSPFWTIHPVNSRDVTVDNIKIFNPPGTHNTDGINPESCKNVKISNCLIEADDDCITLKSGRDSDGRRVGLPCENITITNCILNRGYGGITIGSEMSGGVRNVVVNNCIIRNVDWGIRIKTQRGRGGVIENISIGNIIMEDVIRGISINARYTDLPPEIVSERTPEVKNIRMNGLIIKNSKIACEILGLPEMPFEGLYFDNLEIEASTGFFMEDTKNITLRNIDLDYNSGPAVRMGNISNILITGFSANPKERPENLIILTNIDGAEITSLNYTLEPDCLLKISSDGNKNIRFRPSNKGEKKKICAGKMTMSEIIMK